MRYSFESKLRAVRLAAAGMSIAEAARRQGASRSTVHRWWRRYAAGRRERAARPHRSPRRLAAQAEAEIAALRRATGAGPVALGAALGRPASTVGKVLRRAARWYAGQGIEVEQVMTPATEPPRSAAAGGRPAANWASSTCAPAHRAKALASWLRWYNRCRPHASARRPPARLRGCPQVPQQRLPCL